MKLELSENGFKEIINNKNVNNNTIIRINKNNNIKTKYLYISTSKNNIFYHYFKKPIFPGKGKIDLI